MFTIWSWAIRPLPSVNGIVNTVGQRAGRERRGERRAPSSCTPSGLTRDPGVLGLELADLQVQRVDRRLGGAGPEHADRDRHGLVLGGRGAARFRAGGRGRRRDRRGGRRRRVSRSSSRRRRGSWSVRTVRASAANRRGCAVVMPRDSSLDGPCVDRVDVVVCVAWLPSDTAGRRHQLLLMPLPLSTGRPRPGWTGPGGSRPSHRPAGARGRVVRWRGAPRPRPAARWRPARGW